jgi:hypothetical protein
VPDAAARVVRGGEGEVCPCVREVFAVMVEARPDSGRALAGGDVAASDGGRVEVDDVGVTPAGAEPGPDGCEVLAGESDAVALERESGANATDSVRFRAAADPVATAAEAGSSRAVIFATDAHLDGVAQPRAATNQARPSRVRTESGMRQTAFGMMRMPIGPPRARSHLIGARRDLRCGRVELLLPRCVTLRTRCRPCRTRCTPRRARCNSMSARLEM